MLLVSLWKAIVWAVFIMIISAIPGKIIEPYAIWNADKLVHAGIYFFLTAFIIAGLTKQKKYQFLASRAILIAVFFSIIYGGLIEVLQENCFINRSGNFPDFFANSFGAIAAVLLYSRIIKLKLIKKVLL